MNQEHLIIKKISGRGLPLPGNDIDTDRIIPARYLKCVTFDKLGEYAFQDARFNEDGSRKDHPFNDERYKGASILIVNRNFGCGSSREHAPQSLLRYGIKAIIGESFAEIFSDNCTAIGLPVATAQKADIDNLMYFIREDPACEIVINLETQEASYGDFTMPIIQPEKTMTGFLNGKWDSTSDLLAQNELIRKIAGKIPYMNGFKI